MDIEQICRSLHEGLEGPNGTPLMMAQRLSSLSLAQSTIQPGTSMMQNPQQAKQKKPRRTALQIIDPDTGLDVLAECVKEPDGDASKSLDSSAGHTRRPQGSMSNKGLADLVRLISIAEKSLIGVEEKAKDLSQIKTADSTENMKYVMKSEYTMLEHPLVRLVELLDVLHRLRRSLLASNDAGTAFDDLVKLYRGATVLGKTNMGFPPVGVYVDLRKGFCAIFFHDLLEKLVEIKRKGTVLSKEVRKRILEYPVIPLIEVLADYDTALENRDPSFGICNARFFEEVYSARWVKIKVEDEPTGHYEMRNIEAWTKRPFVHLSNLLPILYSRDISERGNWLGEKANHRDQVKQLLYEKSLYLLRDPSARFPAEGVYVDLADGECFTKLMYLLNTDNNLYSGDVLELVEGYESCLDNPKSGIYDRAHFEKHVSAKWIPD